MESGYHNHHRKLYSVCLLYTSGKTYGIYLVLGILFATGVQEKLLKKNKNRLWVILLLLALFWASVYCMYLGMDDPFLYFRF